ncbi:glycosyltransferase [Sphingomonas sp. DT-51]|uniref:glycosyltransferase n=1 Tax=Sphingomonas sp. DT-51 TaxID=3396165 RepID=UPI003F1B2042
MTRQAGERALKIAYLSKEMPFGATEAFILPEVADHLAAGWDVWLVPLSQAAMVHGQHLLDRTLAAPVVSRRVLAGALAEAARRPWRALTTLATIARAPSPALALRNLAVFPKGLWLARELRQRQFDHVHIHWIAAPATMGVVAARMAGVPYSITAHRYDIAQGNLVGWKAEGARFVRAIDAPGASELAIQFRPHTPAPLVLHMGVTVPPVATTPRAGALDEVRIATAARLVDKKGHVYLIEALRLARDRGQRVHLDVFGDGPLGASLREQAERLDVASQITWHGVTAHDTLLQALTSGRYDASVLASVTAADGDKEGIPVFLIESMGAGLPVITTANGGIAELAGDGCGLMVPERDAPAIAEALVTLGRDHGLRVELSRRGRERVLNDFEIGACMAHFRSLVQGGEPSSRLAAPSHPVGAVAG